jgi:hypothetical protein
MKALYLLAFAALLTACNASVDTPGATIRGDGYRIDLDGDGHHPHGGRHCPPGHAKKGWC